MKRFIKAILPRSLHSPLGRLYWQIRFGSRMKFPRSKPHLRSMKNGSADVMNCCIAYNKYGGYCVPLVRHDWVVQWILSGDVYEPATIDFIMSHCKDGDIIHAGTYFGDFLPALSQSCDPGAKIWAFEPHSEYYRCALITLYINGLRNVELFNAGLAERRESGLLLMSNSKGQLAGAGGSIVKHEGGRDLAGANRPDLRPDSGHAVTGGSPSWWVTDHVQLVTLDEIVPPDRRVSIIHLDVEGHEQQALSGAMETIRRCLPIIIVETVPSDGWLSENLWPLGYRIAPDKISLFNTVLMRD